MRRVDDGPIDPQIAATLEAVEATLAGEPVDPVHAEVAELALLLAAERPAIDHGFADRLERAVQRRFVPLENTLPDGPAKILPALRRRWWFWTPAAGLAAALIAAVVVVAAGGNSRSVFSAATSSNGTVASPSAKVPSPSAKVASPSAPNPASRVPSLSAAHSSPPLTGTSSTPSQTPPGAVGGGAASSQSAGSTGAAAGAPSGSLALQLPANGRKVIQGAQLALSTAPSRIDTVAQEVFTVVGQVQGIVNSSTVTATNGPDSYAQFQLSIPSATLSQAMASLSTLRYARVASRTDTTQDVNNQYETDVRSLSDARALRTSLLKQLAAATTQAQIDSLTARIHDAEASISSDEATLRALNHQINYSQVSVIINGGIVPVPVSSSHGGFGVGQAAHDAGRVLTVAAGIALIGAAALVPLGLLAALAWWIASALRRRRREQALDLV